MKKLLYLFLVLGISSVSFGQTTLIPDPNFEQALIDLGYDTPPINGSVPTANISNVTSLNVNNKNISDLTGIEDFIALTELYCIYNQLTSLNVSNNSLLSIIWCWENQLTSLDLGNNNALTYLVCSSNQLTSLNVSNNNALTSLGCSSNQLTSLNVSNNNALTSLACSSNQLTSLNVSNNPSLQTLTCSGNQLTSLDVSNNTSLQSLWCDVNQLTSLNVSNNPLLQEFVCNLNPLTSLDVSNNPSLQTFSCGGNELTSLDLSNNPLLQYLNCWENQLTSLDLSNNTALSSIYCHSNQLTSLDVRNEANTLIMGFFSSNNPNLTCIYVDNAEYSSQNWTEIDPNSTFVENEAECALDVADNSLDVDLILYPSPTDNYLFIQGTTSHLSTTVYNMLGKQVLYVQNTDKIDVSGLSDGVYIIKLSDGVNEAQRKFIKN
jgi:Leucine-rich repeat (LRR) protein